MLENGPLMGHRNRPHRSERQALYGPRRGRGRDFSARRRPPTGGFNEQREREDRAWLIVCAVGPRMTDVVVLTMSEFGRAEPSLDPVSRGGGQSDPFPRREPGVPPCGSSGRQRPREAPRGHGPRPSGSGPAVRGHARNVTSRVTPGGVLTVPAGSRSLTPARRQTTLVPPV